MISVLHGDNHILSRYERSNLVKQAKKKQEIIVLNGEKIDLTDLKQALETESLFTATRMVVIDNIFSRRVSKEKKQLLTYLKNHQTNSNDLLIWEKKELTPATLRSLPEDWKQKKYKITKTLFKLLDSIRPNNISANINLLKLCRQDTANELIFFLLARRIKDLIIAHDLGKEGLKGSPWQIGTLVSQAKNYQLKQLINLSSKLENIEFQIKSGQSIMPLDWHLDLLMTEI